MARFRTRGCATGSLILLIVLAGSTASGWCETNDLLATWLATRTQLHTWSAHVAQTRVLKTLAQPVTTTGRVWFEAPNRFRWELGNPPRTLAVRQPDRLVLLYPLLHRAEIYPLAGTNTTATAAWHESLALLEAGFPRNAAELEQRFELLSMSTNSAQLHVSLRPRSASARRWMPQINLVIATVDFSLQSTELRFADGSRLRNDFTNAVVNRALDAALFEPQIPTDYTVTQPSPEARR